MLYSRCVTAETPYDAVFAEYKRQLAFRTGVNITTEELKSSTAGQTVEAFLNVSTNTTSDVWKKRLRNYIPRWLKHAKYWLTEYTRPLHILIYNRVKENPMEEIEKMQAFLGYQFDGANFRHCCVVKNPENKSLKRQPGPIDKYRNYALEQEAVIRRKYKDAVSKVHDMLDKKFPNTKYRITRG
ncbi:hypothetical protein EB796_015341 [Bugula neritina]|uniref:Sulfotransferase domain-containing protein n=1 Tax=Bugula neritina TaxID=10212 RepID=A0A7J7JJY5_BUGNE|nr:hypothetical protein EB796_015341 [Bugula neritina]